jgi:ribosome-associated toxin RatA of RatAB toxin-antitoxin module
MPKVTKSTRVNYSAAQMCALVCDINSYPQFIPACVASNIISSDTVDNNSQQVVASLDFAKGPFNISFTTKNIIEQQCINIDLVKGPFKHLQGQWLFVDLDNNSSQVQLNVCFEITNKLVAIAMDKVLTTAADKLVEAFCDRAKLKYGSAAK